MKYRWHVHYHEQGMTQPGDKTKHVPMTTAVEGTSKDEALAAFLAKHPRVIRESVKFGKKAYALCETIEELAEWMKMHRLTVEDVQGAAQVMCINSRPENIPPFDCPKCGFDLNKDIDHHDNAYFCPKCKTLIQTG